MKDMFVPCHVTNCKMFTVPPVRSAFAVIQIVNV